MRWKILPALVLLIGFAAAALYVERRSHPPQNLILITVDTLRADHLGTWGYQRETSPELDRRAKNALVFEKALVQWPKTVPSMVSMFTSTYPHTNGILFGSSDRYVPDQLVSIAEVLKDQGFLTYGLTSNAVLADATNFSQGFDFYDQTWKDRSRGKEHSRADHVTDFALRALERLNGKKFFLWIHYVDPHYNYHPPAPFDGMFVGDRFYHKRRILKINQEENNYYGGLAGRVWNIDHNQEWDYYIAQYDAEIRFVDFHLKRLFAAFDRMRLWKNSLVCFTADHGESLGENHYFFEHGWFPYTSCSHVPLLIWDPDRKPRRIGQSVALIDLAPTILRRLQIPIPQTFEGKPWGEPIPERPIYIDSGEGQLNESNYIRSLWIWPYHFVYVPSPIYQRMMKKTLFELYNVEKDPYEKKNLVSMETARAAELQKLLLERVKSTHVIHPKRKREKPRYSQEDIEQMRSLGYVQ
jgi:arylsulfatase A-like enzyme